MIIKNRTELIIFSVTALIALAFALYTDHRWEDWYITYRASKNMALGYGLVFNAGEAVHSFTSPIGTLIPAFLRMLVESDDTVLWLFRIINAIVLGFTSILLFRMISAICKEKWAPYFMVAIFSMHILIVDFSINGMETAFMMFFLGLYMYSYLTPEGKSKLIYLTLAMIGLIYTRPDGVVYGGALSLGFFLFDKRENSFKEYSLAFIRRHAIAIGITALAYLPWFISVWMYYGSPIPHTITAKGALIDYSVSNLFLNFIAFPINAIIKSNTLNLLFLTPYCGVGSWFIIHFFSKIFSVVTAFYFFYFRGFAGARAISFGVFILHYYLNYISGQGGMPWYLPNIALPSMVVLTIIVDRLDVKMLTFGKLSLKPLIIIGIVGYQAAFLFFGARLEKKEQDLIEFGNRKKIGEWLHANAKKDDTVFLECLGYIGYYSQLKTYDFPGMSSPEVVAARKKHKSDKYAVVIRELLPVWLVLRPNEVDLVQKDDPTLLSKYEMVKEFDVRHTLPKRMFPFGSGILGGGDYFKIYHIKN